MIREFADDGLPDYLDGKFSTNMRSYHEAHDLGKVMFLSEKDTKYNAYEKDIAVANFYYSKGSLLGQTHGARLHIKGMTTR